MFKLIATGIGTDERESRSSASSAQDLLQFLPTNLAYLYLKRIRLPTAHPCNRQNVRMIQPLPDNSNLIALHK